MSYKIQWIILTQYDLYQVSLVHEITFLHTFCIFSGKWNEDNVIRQRMKKQWDAVIGSKGKDSGMK